MKQGNGSDLLSANDPRNATIGMIYVAPADDRESVLAAILTQEKLGRKQIAIVLPNQNKAFQRPVDFDGLKNMRRKLAARLRPCRFCATAPIYLLFLVGELCTVVARRRRGRKSDEERHMAV